MVLIPRQSGLRTPRLGRFALCHRWSQSVAPFPWTAYRGSLRVFAVGSATTNATSVLKVRLRQAALLGVLSMMLSFVVAQPASAAPVLPVPATATLNTVFLDVRSGATS